MNVFLKKLVVELPKRSNINEHTIDMEPNKKLLYRPIYSLGQVELETLITYIETNLAIGFIQPSKSPTKVFILFVQKPDGSFYLYFDYQSLNNLTIKN